MNRQRRSLFATSFTRWSDDDKIPRLCVRTLACSNEFPSSRPLPSTASAADCSALFGGFISTMSRSDSRPQLGAPLRSPLATHPRREPLQRTRPGLLGSENDPSDVTRSTTPVERHRLAYRRCTCCLHGREPTRPPRNSAFRSLPRTPHDSCLRFGPCVTATPARLGPDLPATALARQDFHLQVTSSFAQRTPKGC